MHNLKIRAFITLNYIYDKKSLYKLIGSIKKCQNLGIFIEVQRSYYISLHLLKQKPVLRLMEKLLEYFKYIYFKKLNVSN